LIERRDFGAAPIQIRLKRGSHREATTGKPNKTWQKQRHEVGLIENSFETFL
jgi:hypothetical protein